MSGHDEPIQHARDLIRMSRRVVRTSAAARRDAREAVAMARALRPLDGKAPGTPAPGNAGGDAVRSPE